MRITDLMDVAYLRELNSSLSDALGLAMALTDEEGRPITATADWYGEFNGYGEDAAVPVCIDGIPVATWHLKRSCANGRNETHSYGKNPDISRDSLGRAGSTCELLETPPALQEGAVALVSSVARMTIGYAYANLGLLHRVHQHAAAALDATGDAANMQRLVDVSPVGLLELNREGSVCWANERALEMLGMEEFESRGIAGPGAPWMIESIGGIPFSVAWIHIARQLVRGETVHDLGCEITRSRGRTLRLRVDAAPVRSANGSLNRVMCAISEANEHRANPGNNLSISVNRQCVEPLTHAWLELDAARQSLKRGDADIAGRLDIVACLLQETVCTMHEAQCRGG